jgi:DNA repair exonuclease SbcCD ATPase subunit
MKTITLKSITLRNFRGEKERTTSFNDEVTTIMGGNGLGKSRHFDAFCWLLFGKDVLERKDFNVRSLVGGEPLHRVECSVAAELVVDGEVIALKRALVEKWVKPRGQVDEVFKGNETETFWNDVPISVTEYQNRVNGIISDTVFKMVTNPLYFATQLKWGQQREQLFQLAGAISDSDIAAQKPEFAALLDKISGKSFADFKREIAARKKRLKDELDGVQPRIDQTQKLMPETADFATLEAEIKGYEQKLAEMDKAIADVAEATRQQGEARQKKQAEINNLKQKQQDVLHREKNDANEAAFNANAARRKLKQSIADERFAISDVEISISGNQQEIKILKKKIEERRRGVDKARVEWEVENSKEYKEADACLTCPIFNITCTDSSALSLHAENIDKARQTFDELVQKSIEWISERGKSLKEDIARLEKEIEKLVERNEELNATLPEQKENLAALQKQFDETPVAAQLVNPDEVAEYAQLSAQIKTLETELNSISVDTPTSAAEFRAQKTAIASEISARRDKLRNRDLIAKYKQEIADLLAHGQMLGQQIADVEQEEYLMQQFSRVRIEECEHRINALFTQVTFRLFEYTIDGNESETCVPLVNGVPFDVANTAGQVNAGLDIINVLSYYYSVSAPIFIDHRESVNNLIHTESQIINLVVSNDKELIIK